MTALLVAGLLAAGVAGLRASPVQPGQVRGVEIAQLMFHSRMVVRVQTFIAGPPLRKAWREKKGPTCLPMGDVLGAAVVVPRSVDFVVRGGDRVRARFASSCPALDYYSGFYVVPGRDGKICASRDVVRDRAGGECEVDKLRSLEARK